MLSMHMSSLHVGSPCAKVGRQFCGGGSFLPTLCKFLGSILWHKACGINAFTHLTISQASIHVV